MKPENELEIRKYLLKKKMSRPLYDELADHFVSEVENKMRVGTGFQEAFLDVKVKWHLELQMVRPDILSFKKVTRIEAQIMGNRFANITKLAGKCAMGTVIFVMLYEPFSLYLPGVLLLIFSILTLYMLVTRKMKLLHYLQLNFHPLVLKNTVISIVWFSSTVLIADWFLVTQRDIKDIIQSAVVVFCLVVQIQLMWLHHKKFNVLLS